MYNRNSYNSSQYDGLADPDVILSPITALRFVAFPKKSASLPRRQHVRISRYGRTQFPNEQVVIPVVVIPPQPLQIGNPIGLLLALTYSDGSVAPVIPPAPIVDGNPIGLLLALTVGHGGTVGGNPFIPVVGHASSLLLALTSP